jgi:S1-C subfamily serine protease
MRRLAATAVVAVMLAGCGGDDKPDSPKAVVQTQTTKVEVVKGLGDQGGFDAQSIYKERAPGVVTVISLTESKVRGRQAGGLGSGFVLDGEGYIATNAHVVTDDKGKPAKDVFVQFGDGNRVPATIKGTDKDSDVGLLKIDPSDLRGPNVKLVPLPFGSTEVLAVGDPVAAIGSPFGEEQSLSTGVVSALDRDIESLNSQFRIGNAVQTDTAINHGNSGGPLLDSKGRVIGINSQIRSTGGGGEGVGFAIPVETVKHSLEQMRKKGHADYAYLGISSVSLYPQLAERLGLEVLSGALVESVQSGSPAARAGLSDGDDKTIDFQGQRKVPADGDVVVAVGGKPLTPTDDLADVVSLHQPGEKVQLQILRDGKKRTIEVTLGKRPERG